MGWQELYERARQRNNVVVRQDAVECDIPMSVFDDRMRQERWPRPFLGTRLLPGTEWSPLVQLTAATCSIRWPAAADAWSAAWLYEVRSAPPRRPMVVVPGNRRPRRSDMVVRRCQDWDDAHVRNHRGVWVLQPGRLLVDLARQGHDRDELLDLSLALQLKVGLVGPDIVRVLPGDLDPMFEGLLRELARLVDECGSESGLEKRVRRMLIEAGFTPDTFQLTVTTRAGRRRLDIVFERARVGIEVQSTTYHGDEPGMTRDAVKLNALTVDDEWRVLLVTPSMLLEPHWSEFCAGLRVLLARREGIARP